MAVNPEGDPRDIIGADAGNVDKRRSEQPGTVGPADVEMESTSKGMQPKAAGVPSRPSPTLSIVLKIDPRRSTVELTVDLTRSNQLQNSQRCP